MDRVISNSKLKKVSRCELFRIIAVTLIVFYEACQGGTAVELSNEVRADDRVSTSASLIGQVGGREPDSRELVTVPVANPSFEAAFQGDCGKNNNDNPCEHICLDLHDGTYECSCFYGFTLAVDGYSCPPIAAPSSSPNSSASLATLSSLPEAPSDERNHQGSLLRYQPEGRQYLQAPLPSQDDQTPNQTFGHDNSTEGPETLTAPKAEASSKAATSAHALGQRNLQNERRGCSGGSACPANDNRKLVRSREESRPVPANDPSKEERRREEHSEAGLAEGAGHQIKGKAVNEAAEGGSQQTSSSRHLKELLSIPARRLASLSGERFVLSEGRRKWKISNRPKNGQHYPQVKPEDGAERWTNTPDGHELNLIGSEASRRQNKGAQLNEGAELGLDSWRELTDDKKNAQSSSSHEENDRDDNETLSYATTGDQDMIDPDIRSIMSKNDKLVENLVNTISRKLDGSAQERPEHEREDVRLDLSLLYELVSASIEEHNKTILTAPAKLKWLENGNRSSLANRRRRHLRRRTARPSWKNLLFDLALCKDEHDENVKHSNCNELENKCDSGGRCITEEVAILEPEVVGSKLGGSLRRARCQCPIGRGGLLCQKPLQRIVPRFTGHSYLTLPMSTDDHLTTLRFLFKPEVGLKAENYDNNDNKMRETLLLYSSSFILLLDEFSRIELRYSTGNDLNSNRVTSGELTRVIGSRDVLMNDWNELIVSDATNDIAAGGQFPDASIASNRIILVTPEKIKLKQDSGQLFVGGLPDNDPISYNNIVPLGSATTRRTSNGFAGCIKKFSINDRSYNLNSDFKGDVLDGFDIGECCR